MIRTSTYDSSGSRQSSSAEQNINNIMGGGETIGEDTIIIVAGVAGAEQIKTEAATTITPKSL